MSYDTQAATAVYTEAQKKFWDDQALTIADCFESVYDDMVDDMVVTSITVKEDSGYYYGQDADYYLAEDNSFLVAMIDIRYDFTKDGLIYSYESYAEIDLNGDVYDDMNRLRTKAKAVAIRPTEQVASHILTQPITESRLTA